MYDDGRGGRSWPVDGQGSGSRHGRPSGHSVWASLAIVLLMAAGAYGIASLFDSSWVGEHGRSLGGRLRTVWGGAVLVPFLFWIYLCLAWLVRSRVPRLLRQILGTIQLYVSLAFMLGVARHAGWDPGWLILEPGEVGSALARFFILNLGAFGAMLVAAASFLLASVFFGSRVLVRIASSVPQAPSEDVDEEELGPFAPPAPPPYPQRTVWPHSPAPRWEGWQRGVAVFPEGDRRLEGGDIPNVPMPPRPQGPFEMEEGLHAPTVSAPASTDAAPHGAVPPPSYGPEADCPSSSIDIRPTAPVPPGIRYAPPPTSPYVDTIGEIPSPRADALGGDGGATSLTPVDILDGLIASFEAGAFAVPRHLLRPLDDAPHERQAPEPRRTTSGADDLGIEEGRGWASGMGRPIVPHELLTMTDVALGEGEMPSSAPPPSMSSIAPAGGTSVRDGAEDIPLSPHDVMPPSWTAPQRPVAEPAMAGEEDGRDTAVPAQIPEPIMPEEGEAVRPLAGLFPPPLDIFGSPAEDEGEQEAMDAARRQGDVIVETLANFGVIASVAHIVIGPSVVQFQLELAPGTKVNKVTGLANDLTMALAVVSVRVEAPILGQHYVGIEIPNSKRRGIPLRSAMESEEFQHSDALMPLPMGMQVDSRFLICGLEDMPHLLVAGTTGSGKSVFVNACILGMCSRRTPDELKLILVDPKHVEFAIYEGLPHLLARPISDPRKAIDALNWAVQEMESRTESFARARVRNLASYNEKLLPKDRCPNIVVVVDELADLMYTAGKEVEGLIARLAQKARAAGIHLILATQRPSVDVITGLIKANVPARVAFAVPSQTDSRTIIDAGGADKLLGKGDMLFLSTRHPRPLRLQSPFITEERTLDFVEHMKGVFGAPEYIEFAESGGNGNGDGGKGGNGALDDPKLEEAIRAVMEMGITSASGLQRILSIGYPKAGRLVSTMERLGILGPQLPGSTRPRDILMDEESAYEALERARAGTISDEG